MEFFAVIDTNVFVSALLTQNSQSATVKVLRLIKEEKITPMYNEDIFKEYSDVLYRERFGIDVTQVKELLDAIQSRGINCERKRSNCLMPDPNDIVFYEISLSREDAYLVTGNLKHFPKNGRVVSPADMVQIVSLAECPKDLLCESRGPKYQSEEEREICERGWAAFEELRRQAVINGTAGMSLEEINEEIRLARKELRERKAREVVLPTYITAKEATGPPSESEIRSSCESEQNT